MKIKGSLFSSSLRTQNSLLLEPTQVFQVAQQQIWKLCSPSGAQVGISPAKKGVGLLPWICQTEAAEGLEQRALGALSGHSVTSQSRAGLDLSPPCRGISAQLPSSGESKLSSCHSQHDPAAFALRWVRVAHSDCRDHFLDGTANRAQNTDHPNPAFN